MAYRWLLLALLTAATARAEPTVTLRMAAIAPEGSAWAREMHAYSRDVEAQTGGRVKMKWYLGAIAGDELASLERVKKRQLDGLAGASFCQRLSPSMWVTRVAALVRDREQQRLVLNKLRPVIDKEFDQNGMVALGVAPFGTDIVFTRAPVRSVADLRKLRLWIYDLDDVLRKHLTAMGLNLVPLPVTEAAQAIDEGKVDGILAPPTVALAYQWSSRMKYVIDLPIALLAGCLTVSHAAFDAISIEDQKEFRAATAKFVMRFIDVGVHQDDMLLSGLFEKQGVKRLAVTPSFFDEYVELAAKQRSAIGEKLVPKALLDEVLHWLSDGK